MREEHADLVEFLYDARQSVINLGVLQKNVNAAEIEGKKLEKALSAERKAVADQIALTVKKRKDEIAEAYDREIRGDQEKLKKPGQNGKRRKTKG